MSGIGWTLVCIVWVADFLYNMVECFKDGSSSCALNSRSYLLGSMCVVPTYIEARREPPLFRRCVRRPSINVLCHCVPQYEYLKPHPVVNPELVSRT